MRLILDLLPAWPRKVGRGRMVVGMAPDVRMEIWPLRPIEELPPDIHKAGVPADAQQDVQQAVEERTATGWPMRMVFSVLKRGDTVIEARLDVVFVVLVYTTLVRVRAASLESYRKLRPEIMRILRSARPDLGGGRIAGVHELWDLRDEEEL